MQRNAARLEYPKRALHTHIWAIHGSSFKCSCRHSEHIVDIRTHDKCVRTYVRTHVEATYVRFNVCEPLMSWSPTNVLSGSPTNLLSCLVVAICRKGTCAMIKIGTNNTVPIPGQLLIRQLQSCIGNQLWQHQFPSVVKLPPKAGRHGFCYSLCARVRLHQHIRTRLHLASPG